MKKSIHARCGATDARYGYTAICGKSHGHTNYEHYDPDQDVYWTDSEDDAR